MKRAFAGLLSALLLLAAAGCGAEPAPDAACAFANPPECARPWVYWYWMRGAVSREGITADLEAMKRAGIGGAYLMPIRDVADPPLFTPPARQLSPEWWALVRFALHEADRLGLLVAMHDCDGFATAGGPWITPELAMQKVVWSETEIAGGQRFDGHLAQPPTKEGYYRDIAVLAFPSPDGTGVSTRSVIPKVTSSLPGINAQGLAGGGVRFRSEEPCWILYEFPEPFTCRSILIRPGGGNYQGNRLIVETSDDGLTFHRLGRLEVPRHGWQDTDADATHSIVPTTARFFRLVYDKEGTERGAEDLDSAKWKNRLLVEQIELSSQARIPHYEGKSGLVWRQSSRATLAQIPDSLCVPLQKVLNLTARLGTNGQLAWDVPAGHWTLLRVGYTPTGHHNDTGGGGKGLECDKFNPQAARVQFDGWFGEVIRQAEDTRSAPGDGRAPPLKNRVLKIFHVDSWEAGSQNWSPVFLEEFERRRGYDPTPYLPTFAGIPVGSADISERFLYDVRRTITDLTTDAFFATMAEQAHAHGCVFSAESVAPTMTGDGMRHYGAVDIPMGEFWLRSPTHDKPNDIQDAVSAAHVYGKPLIQAEAFTELQLRWDEYPAMLKAVGDHNFCLGVNRLVLHVFMHNPWLDRRPGMTLDHIGTFFQRDQTWWNYAAGWTAYLRRCQGVLQEGRPVADIAYFTGEELPSRSLVPERQSPPCPSGYQADSINRDALLRLATVSRGRIQLPGGASYAVLVLPETPLMTRELAAKLEQLVQQGALIVGPPPERSPGLESYPACDKEVRRVVDKLWGTGSRENGWNKRSGNGRVVWGLPLESLLRDRHVAPDFVAKTKEGNPAPFVEWTHRSTPAAEVYFVSNQSGEEQTPNVSLRSGVPFPATWDPVTGETNLLPVFNEKDGRVTLPLHLAPHGSLFIALNKEASPAQSAVGHNSPEPLPAKAIVGPWQVQFDPALGGPGQPVTFATLQSWADRQEPAIRFYSGAAVYITMFDWNQPSLPSRAWLALGNVANIAQVTLNGHDCGASWTPPYRTEITSALRPGTNMLKISVANTWANRLIGDHSLPEPERKTWTTAPYHLENTRLLPSGLLGPVSVLAQNQKP